jgi:hypothetical protein
MRLHSRWMSIIEAPPLAMLAGYGSQSRPREQEEVVLLVVVLEFESRRGPCYVCVVCPKKRRVTGAGAKCGGLARGSCMVVLQVAAASLSRPEVHRQGLAGFYLWL